MLEDVDFTPLSQNQTINTLILENNHLTSLELWPLADCKALIQLKLKNNRLPELDLTPIFLRAHIDLDSSVVISADHILRFALSNHQLKERFLLVRPDKTPWTATPVIIWNNYETLAKRMEWSEIHNRIQTVLNQVSEIDWFAIQRGLMMALSFDELAGYDGDPRNLLSDTSTEMNYKTARQSIFSRAIELLEEQVENGGTTLFLDIESMKTTRASKLIPKVVEARKQEMENTTIQTKGSIALMNSLWLSFYGFKLLEALGIGTQYYGDGLDSIRKSLDDLGFELKTQEVESIGTCVASDPIRASDSLKKHVLYIAEKAYSN